MVISVARSRPATDAQDALSGIKKAEKTCANHTVIPYMQNVTPPKAEPRKPELACALSAGQLHREISTPDLALVDVRAAGRDDENKISGSIRMTLAELHTKRFLRDRHVVLIGNGKAENDLYRACGELLDRGFKSVRVLNGGVPAWALEGYDVSGRQVNVDSALTLTSMELWRETKFSENIILVDMKQAVLAKELPRVDQVVARLTPADLKRATQAVQHARGRGARGSVVLVASTDTSAATIRALRSALRPIPLLAYAGSAQVYRQQLAEQRMIWQARNSGPKELPCGL